MVDVSATQHLSLFYVKIGDLDISEELMLDLHEVTVETSLCLPGVATLVINDNRLRWIDDPGLMPGKSLKVAAKLPGGERPLFDGEIVELEPEFGPQTHRLVVRAFDRLHRLTRGRKARSFQQVTDGDLVSKLAGEAGLTAKSAATSVVHAYAFQHNQTNLEFLRERAAALGYTLFVDGKTLHFEPFAAHGTPVELRWGVSLHEFHPRLTTLEQVDGVVVRGWDPDNRRAIVGQVSTGNGAPQIGEKQSGGELAKAAFKQAATALLARPIRQQAQADGLAQATADRLAGQFIEADGAAGGDPALRAGASVHISGVGERFSGTYLVTSATHTNGLHGYSTHFSVSGHNPATLLGVLSRATADETALPLGGLAVGVVTDNNDPQQLGRVRVKYPWLADDDASYWARVVAPGAGKQRGVQFLPEVNDEVLVGFELGDMQYPYVLGGLWNAMDTLPAPDAVSNGVQKRVIMSRTGHVITLDDSPGAGGITIQDKAGNKIVLDTQTNALTIEVQGNASLKAQGNLTLEAQGQVQLKGMGVTIDGQAATVDVKGTVINLN